MVGSWLEPDVNDRLEELAAEGVADVVAVPFGFVNDHMEVVYDLDIQAKARAEELGLTVVRAATVGTAPPFIAMIRELIAERTEGAPYRGLGDLPPRPLSCAPGCCPAPPRTVTPETGAPGRPGPA